MAVRSSGLLDASRLGGSVVFWALAAALALAAAVLFRLGRVRARFAAEGSDDPDLPPGASGT